MHDDFGCAKEGVIAAWVELAGSDTSKISCGMKTRRFLVDTKGGRRLGSRQAKVFVGRTTRSGCRNGKATFSLRLEPTAKPDP